MATHSSILAWRISWTEEAGYSPWARIELDMTDIACIERLSWKKKKKSALNWLLALVCLTSVQMV